VVGFSRGVSRWREGYLFIISFEDKGVFELSDFKEEDLVFFLFFFELGLDFPGALLVFVDGLGEGLVVFAFGLDCLFEDLYFFFVHFNLVFAGYSLSHGTYSQG
jgi:hypothetical protein